MQKSVAIIGCGTIGCSWIALFLSRGFKVIASDPAPNIESKTRNLVQSALAVLRPEESAAQYEELMDGNLSFVSEADLPGHLPNVDFVQENGPERLPWKQSIFQLLDEHTRPGVLLASSSSGIPSSSFISACHKDPSRVLIGHPFNPPHLIPTVEVVPHPGTSEDAIAKALDIYKLLGRKPVVIKKECPGFVGNRLQAALVHEAYSLVSRGIVSAKDIDSMVSDCLALRWAIQGPFLTKVLGGGGGGIDGFKHAIEHTGPANETWLEDMDKHRFRYTPDSVEKLVSSVEEELKDLGDVDLVAQRNNFLQSVQTLKEGLRTKEV